MKDLAFPVAGFLFFVFLALYAAFGAHGIFIIFPMTAFFIIGLRLFIPE